MKQNLEELIFANKRLALQNEEKEKRAQELIVANKELAFQKEEKEKRAQELIVANKELAYQNEEKEKRAQELIVANKELAFQNKEKEKRAQELIVANRELAYQNEEKEKRAQELIIANKELAYQNEEKEKRAQELIDANKELAYQNEEKEKRAHELVMANTELTLQSGENEKRAQELEHTERQLKESNKELEAFSYSVSHDLRAPLRAIGGYSAMLKEDYELQLDAEANRLIDVIITNTKKMGELIDNLLSFSKMARLEAVSESVDMNRLVKTCTEELMQTENQTKYSFTAVAMPPCAGDINMLKQVWQNLIGNAIKYSSKILRPQIETGATEDITSITYYVKDNGTGFDMKYADKLFGVFQRLHRNDEFEGTGLGLALAKRIVSKHGGEIWGESVLHKGTTFYFSIPKTINI